MNSSITIGDVDVKPGEKKTINLPLPTLYTSSSMDMPIHVINGMEPGPRLFVSAALHGNEINGVEIIHRLIKQESDTKNIKGTLIAIPVVNVFGFISQSRYLPDRRDLNRSFPGSKKGSMAARLAHLFMNEIVKKCTHGIDLHTGAIGRTNLPQIRATLEQSMEIKKMACAFGAPVVMDTAKLMDGTLRKAAYKHDIPMLLYEAGEALRFDEVVIRAGVSGVINVMRFLEMLEPDGSHCDISKKPLLATSSSWVRAPQSGILRAVAEIGTHVEEGEVIGIVSDPFGDNEGEVLSTACGIVIGRTKLPLVYEGEALFHIAHFHEPSGVIKAIEALHNMHGDG
jgi:predicted deacylase